MKDEVESERHPSNIFVQLPQKYQQYMKDDILYTHRVGHKQVFL